MCEEGRRDCVGGRIAVLAGELLLGSINRVYYVHEEMCGQYVISDNLPYVFSYEV